jgi:hypothetical protein
LRDDAEYRRAIRELHSLGNAALGTPRTRGLQDLVDCMLDDEVAQDLSSVSDGTAAGHCIGAGRPPQERTRRSSMNNSTSASAPLRPAPLSPFFERIQAAVDTPRPAGKTEGWLLPAARHNVPKGSGNLCITGP